MSPISIMPTMIAERAITVFTSQALSLLTRLHADALSRCCQDKLEMIMRAENTKIEFQHACLEETHVSTSPTLHSKSLGRAHFKLSTLTSQAFASSLHLMRSSFSHLKRFMLTSQALYMYSHLKLSTRGLRFKKPHVNVVLVSL